MFYFYQYISRAVAGCSQKRTSIFSLVPYLVYDIVVIMYVFGNRTDNLSWLDKHHVETDKILKGKEGLLILHLYNCSINYGLWALVAENRQMSIESDKRGAWIMRRQRMDRKKLQGPVFIVYLD